MTIATGYPADFPGPRRQELLGQILKRMELVKEDQIQQALEIQKKQGGVIGEIMIELGFVARGQVLLALSIQMGAEIADPLEIAPQAIQAALDAYLDEKRARDEVEFAKLEEEHREILPIDDLANSPPVVKLVNIILVTALRAGATELRIEALDDKFSVRYRVEGILNDMESPPFHLGFSVIGRLLSEIGMDVSQRGRVQERRVMLRCAGRRYQVETTYRPSIQGEGIFLIFSEGPMAAG